VPSVGVVACRPVYRRPCLPARFDPRPLFGPLFGQIQNISAPVHSHQAGLPAGWCRTQK
jgi:hypothetical protein